MAKFRCKYNGTIIEVEEIFAHEIRSNDKYEEVDPKGSVDYPKMLHEANIRIEELEAEIAILKKPKKRGRPKKEVAVELS